MNLTDFIFVLIGFIGGSAITCISFRTIYSEEIIERESGKIICICKPLKNILKDGSPIKMEVEMEEKESNTNSKK